MIPVIHDNIIGLAFKALEIDPWRIHILHALVIVKDVPYYFHGPFNLFNRGLNEDFNVFLIIMC